MTIPYSRAKCKPLVPFCRHFVTFSASFSPPVPFFATFAPQWPAPSRRHRARTEPAEEILSSRYTVLSQGAEGYGTAGCRPHEKGGGSGPATARARRPVSVSAGIRPLSRENQDFLQFSYGCKRVPGRDQKAHSPFSKMVTVSPDLVTPITWVSGAPIITSSWMAESLRPFSSSWARVMAAPPLMLVG